MIEWKVNLKDSKLMKEKKAKVYGLIEEHCDTLGLREEI